MSTKKRQALWACRSRVEGMVRKGLANKAGNEQIEHGDNAGGGGSEDEAFEAGFFEIGLFVHGLR